MQTAPWKRVLLDLSQSIVLTLTGTDVAIGWVHGVAIIAFTVETALRVEARVLAPAIALCTFVMICK